MKTSAFLLVLTLAQQPAPSSLEQKTQGTCSPAVADVNGNVTMTLTCTGLDAKGLRDIQRALALLQQLVAATNDIDPVSAAFPVEYYVKTKDHLPLVLPARPFPWQFLPYFNELLKENPAAVEGKEEGPEGRQLYHEFLQKTLFDWINTRYAGNWRKEIMRFETGLETYQTPADAVNGRSQLFSQAEVERIFAENRFAKFQSITNGNVAFPPGSKLTVITPKKDSDHGQIRITNEYAELLIDTQYAFGMRSLHEYGKFLNLSASNEEFWTHSFIVKVEATFVASKANASEMPHIRQWAKNIVSGLQGAFDEQVIRRKFLDTYQIEQQRVGPGWPGVSANDLGTIRAER